MGFIEWVSLQPSSVWQVSLVTWLRVPWNAISVSGFWKIYPWTWRCVGSLWQHADCVSNDALIWPVLKKGILNDWIANLYPRFWDYCGGAWVWTFLFCQEIRHSSSWICHWYGAQDFFPISVRMALLYNSYPSSRRLCSYGRLGWWSTEIKTGTPVSLTLADDGKVKRINLSGKKLDQTALPMQVTQFDFEDKLFIKGLVLEEEKTLQSIMMQRLLKKMEPKYALPFGCTVSKCFYLGQAHHQLCRSYE